jgi:Uma2 family endonuclease
MAMPQPHVEWTLEMLHALPEDGNRYELIDGELLVSPSPSAGHQRALGILHYRAREYLTQVGGYEVFFAPAAITFTQRRELQPDLLVIRLENDIPVKLFSDVKQLTLAVEVLSPSTARNDRYKKRRVYQEQATTEYWIVDPGSRLVERWRPEDSEPEVLTEVLEWRPDASRALLVIDLAAFFREANGR